MSGQDITTAGVVPTAVSGLLTASAVLDRRLIFDLNYLDMKTTLWEIVTGRFWKRRQEEKDWNNTVNENSNKEVVEAVRKSSGSKFSSRVQTGVRQRQR